MNLGERQAAGRASTSASTLPGLSQSGADVPPNLDPVRPKPGLPGAPNLPQIDISRQPKALVLPLVPTLAVPPPPPRPVVPMTQDRIKRAQVEIEDYLPARQEYIVDTSEFHEVKWHLQRLTDSHRIDVGKVSTPTLRKRIDRQEDGRPNLERKLGRNVSSPTSAEAQARDTRD